MSETGDQKSRHSADTGAQRVARVYAEALLNAAEKQGQVDAILELFEDGVHLALLLGGVEQRLGVDAGHALGAGIGAVPTFLIACLAHGAPRRSRSRIRQNSVAVARILANSATGPRSTLRVYLLHLRHRLVHQAAVVVGRERPADRLGRDQRRQLGRLAPDLLQGLIARRLNL